MPPVFRTIADDPERTDIVGAGTLFPFGKSGVVVEKAALAMPELQEKDEGGGLKLDEQGNPIPLTGADLQAAAEAFAADRGIRVDDVPEDQLDGLPQEAGLPPERPPLAELGHLDYVNTYGEEGLTPVNTDPTAAGPSAGAIVPPKVPDDPEPAPAPPTTPSGPGLFSRQSQPSGGDSTPTTPEGEMN